MTVGPWRHIVHSCFGLAVALLACTHDWGRFESGGGGGAAATGGGGSAQAAGVGGAATMSACQEVCAADRECPNRTESPTCEEDCAERVADCSAEDVTEVENCGLGLQTVCDDFVFRSCTPGCY